MVTLKIVFGGKVGCGIISSLFPWKNGRENDVLTVWQPRGLRQTRRLPERRLAIPNNCYAFPPPILDAQEPGLYFMST